MTDQQASSTGLWSPSGGRPNIIVASPQEVERLERVIRTAVTTFTLSSTDINIDGIYIDTKWLTDDTIPISAQQSLTIDEVIDRSYDPHLSAIISITGEVNAREVVGFLRSIRRNNAHGPSKATRLALLKEW